MNLNIESCQEGIAELNNLIDKDLNGVSLGAVNNCKGTVRGMQIGLYNRTKNLKGVQIGLINKITGKERILPFFPIINVNF
jgi:hypothetical protein